MTIRDIKILLDIINEKLNLGPDDNDENTPFLNDIYLEVLQSFDLL